MSLILWLSTGILNAQTPVQGIVSDVLTEELLDNVEVSFSSSSFVTTTNESGIFHTISNALHPINSNSFNGSLVCFQRYLVWNFNSTFDITIFNSLGQIKLQQRHVLPSGDAYLSNLSEGIYFIHLSSDKGKRIYSLNIFGETCSIGLKKENSYGFSSYFGSDTLLLSNEGYYDLKVPVSETSFSMVQNIRMLKKQYDELYYFNTLLNKNAYDMISSTPSKTHLGDVESVKVVFNSDNDLVYYMNTNIYISHYNFAVEHLDYTHSHSTFNAQQYVTGSQRYLYPFTLNYYTELDIYTFEFFSGTGAECSDVNWCYEKLLETSYLADKLYFYSTNELWDNCDEIPTITPNELFEGQNYQALNIAENYGYLQKVNIEDIDDSELQRHDIVLTNGIPIDISVIAGIITTEFQTPLSHINVLSHNRGTPNMALKDGYTSPKLDTLLGQLVYLQVLSDSFNIRSATIEEANEFWNSNEPTDTILLEKDTADYGLLNLDSCSINDVNNIGGKASNFAELLNSFNNAGIPPPVPEGYFAIPFHYYEQHLLNYGLDTFIDNMLADSSFVTNSDIRKAMLAQLRDSIINSPIDPIFLSNIITTMQLNPQFSSYRFRSSTNAEDLEGFNGAGLYSSYSGKLDDVDKPVDRAIKKFGQAFGTILLLKKESTS